MKGKGRVAISLLFLLATKQLGVLKNLFKRVHAVQIEFSLPPPLAEARLN